MSPRPPAHIDEVWPGITVSDQRSACDADALASVKCDAVLNVGDVDIGGKVDKNLRYTWFTLEDSAQCDPQLFMSAVEQLSEWRREGLRVHVCCWAGLVRSPGLVAAHLVREERKALQTAISELEGRPHEAFDFFHDWLQSPARAVQEGVPEMLLDDPLWQMVGGAHRVMAEARPRVMMRPGLWVALWPSVRQVLC